METTHNELGDTVDDLTRLPIGRIAILTPRASSASSCVPTVHATAAITSSSISAVDARSAVPSGRVSAITASGAAVAPDGIAAVRVLRESPREKASNQQRIPQQSHYYGVCPRWLTGYIR